jgi:hypothetical protein
VVRGEAGGVGGVLGDVGCGVEAGGEGDEMVDVEGIVGAPEEFVAGAVEDLIDGRGPG